MNKHYIQYLFPGEGFAEFQNVEVDTRDISKLEIPKDAFAFHFFDKDDQEKNFSAYYYISKHGQKKTYSQLEKENTNGKYDHILERMDENSVEEVFMLKNGQVYMLVENYRII